MTDDEAPPLVVLDTSVLINFLALDRAELLARLPVRLVVTQHVAAEITRDHPTQAQRLRAAAEAGVIAEVVVNAPEELALFAELSASGRLGAGECSAIALAASRGHELAIDDKRAAREARRVAPEIGLRNTEHIVRELIRTGVLTVIDADAMLRVWADEHRFRLPFASFAEAPGK